MDWGSLLASVGFINSYAGFGIYSLSPKREKIIDTRVNVIQCRLTYVHKKATRNPLISKRERLQ